jgi:hypothetical protein
MPKDVIDAVGAVDVSTAAERLGISVQTLEGVLERGLLKGFKDADGRWKVLLEGGSQEGAGVPPHVSIARETGGGPAPTLSRILDDTRSPLERVLAEQVDFLRVQLADRDRAISDKDAVIADLSRALRALPAPVPTGPAAEGLVARLESAINAVALQLGQQSRGREVRWAMFGIVAAVAVGALVLLIVGGVLPIGRPSAG